MIHSRETNFAAASPRVSPRAMPLVSVTISAATLALFLAALVLAVTADGIAAWTAGLVYIAFDTALLLLIVALTRSMARQPDARDVVTTRPSLGVAIAAHNEATVLPETLTALLAQTDPPDMIAIVDDGSTDATAQMLRERFGVIGDDRRDERLRLISIAQSGKAAALNTALTAIDTDIVVAIDADTILDRVAIAAVRDAFARDASLVAAGGMIAPVCDATALGRAMQLFQTTEYIRSMVARFAWMRAGCLVLISGAFSAFRCDALLRVGGIDTESLAEDYELTHRLHRYSLERNLGWRLQMIPQARAITHAPTQSGAFLMQRRRWFAGYLQVQLWNRDLPGQRRFGALGMLMMPIKVFDTLQPVHGLLSFVLLIAFVAAGRWPLVLTILGIIALKIAFDLVVTLWMVALVRVSGDTSSRTGEVVLASMLEPFSFNPLRQAGAAWGWLSFLTNRHRWGRRTPS